MNDKVLFGEVVVMRMDVCITMRNSFFYGTLLVLALPGFSMADLSDGLVAYYPFNGNADDASGNEHHGGVYGAQLTRGYSGVPCTAYQFDGVDDYISVPYADDFQLQFLTLSAWVRPAVDFLPIGAVIAARGEDARTDSASCIFDIAHPSSQYGDGLRFVYEDRGDTERYFDTGLSPAVNEWTHLAVTRSSTGQVVIYSNGENLAQWDDSEALTTDCFQDFTIGARWWYKSSHESGRLIGFFHGSIDEVRLYKRALTAGEIKGLANH